MIDLKEYIKESLLDDFDTLNKKVTDVIEHPFAELYKSVKNSSNWEAGVENFKAMVTAEAQETINHPLFPPQLSKDEVFVAFYSEEWSPKERIYIQFNKTTFQRFKKSQGRSAAYKYPAIQIQPVKFNGKTSASVFPANNINVGTFGEGYILSKRHAVDALRMLDLMSVYSWNEKYW